MEKNIRSKNGYSMPRLIASLEKTGAELNRSGNRIELGILTGKLIFTSWGSAFLLKKAAVTCEEKTAILELKINWPIFIAILIGTLFLAVFHYRNQLEFTLDFVLKVLVIPLGFSIMMFFYIWLIRSQFIKAIRRARE